MRHAPHVSDNGAESRQSGGAMEVLGMIALGMITLGAVLFAEFSE
jgi:hypothetical protein